MTSLSVATAMLVVATLLPHWRHPHWIVRGLDFPRLQIAGLALVLLVLEAAWLPGGPAAWGLMAVTGACLGWQARWIVPHSRLWPVEAESASLPWEGPTLGVLTANVRMENRQADAFLALVRERRPDLLVVLESDAWWEARLDALQEEMPWVIRCPLDNRYGMHVYSRLPLKDAEVEFLVEEDVPSMHALVCLPSGEGVRAHFLHPAPPSPTENPESSERDAELVIVARSLKDEKGPVVVTGDLNDVTWSPTTRLFKKQSGLLDPRVGRGLFNTFHAKVPLARWPLDHVFHSAHFRLISLERLPPFGSDHFGLFTRLALVDEGTDEEGPRSDPAEESEAERIAREEGVSESDVPRPGLARDPAQSRHVVQVAFDETRGSD